MNCLVTRLKAVVNNPNLPILETMQQVTLDAIAASGNTNMTDAQKSALNHFFYQIGAVSNSALWQKIGGIFLPMICAKNNGTVITNYKTGVVKGITPTESIYISDNGGLVGYGPSLVNGTISGNTRNLGFVMIGANSLLVTSDDGTNLAYKLITPSVVLRLRKISDSNVSYIESGGVKGILGYNASVEGIAAILESDAIHFRYYDGEIKSEISQSGTYTEAVDFEDNTIGIGGRSDFPNAGGVIAVGMTVAEAEAVLVMLKELKDAFIE